MKNLYKYMCESLICEGVYNIAPMDSVSCKQHFDKFKSCKGGKNNIPIEFFDYIYNIWQASFDGLGNNIPFRCDQNSAKLAPIYSVFTEQIIEFGKQNNIDIKKGQDSHGDCLFVNNVKIQFGNGSLGKVRAEKGLQYEDQIVSELVTFVQNVAGAHSEGRVSTNALKALFSDNIVIHHWFDMYESGALDDLINLYIKDPSIDLSKYIYKTGSQDTHRNSKGQLFDKDFNITVSDMEDVLNESGKIISDVTIDGPGISKPVYISVKMKASQLSGVNYNWAMRNNEVFQRAVQSNESYDAVKNDTQMVAFNNFCKTLGMIPEDVFNRYRELYANGKMKDNGRVGIDANYNPKLLGCLIQKLVGGNYWYTKPEYSIFVNDKNAKLSFNVDKAHVTDSGKGVNIEGTINGLPCKIIFRTSGSGIWPYRIFPMINVPKLINIVS